MDARTRKKLLGKAILLMHLIQEHHGAIPAGADYAEILRDGQDAITALALPMVVRQALRKIQPLEPLKPLRVGWGDPSDGRKHIEDLLVDIMDSPVDQWGLPRRDAL